MQTIYQMAEGGDFTGGTSQIKDADAAPQGWTRIAPPEIPDGKRAVWVGDRWIIADPAPSPSLTRKIPEQITCGQGREALYNVGLFANVQPTIDSIEDPDTKWRVQNAWDNRPTWERQSPFVMMMAGILGLNEEQADQLFITAATL